jgi:hypothetical protein
VLIISFTSPNSVLLIQHELERDIRYVLTFLLLYFSFEESLCIYIYMSH